jgi:ribosomal protein L23
MTKTLNLLPRVSEKAYGLSQTGSVYVFVVPKSSNKLTIAQAVAEQFSVTVEDVRTTHLPSKAKRTVRKGGRKVERGTQPGIKKAYVRLKKGDTIPVFAQDEEEKKPVATKRGKK